MIRGAILINALTALAWVSLPREVIKKQSLIRVQLNLCLLSTIQNRGVWSYTKQLSTRLCAFWHTLPFLRKRGCNRILCPVRGFESVLPATSGSEQPCVLTYCSSESLGDYSPCHPPKGTSGCCGYTSRITPYLGLSCTVLHLPFHWRVHQQGV